MSVCVLNGSYSCLVFSYGSRHDKSCSCRNFSPTHRIFCCTIDDLLLVNLNYTFKVLETALKSLSCCVRIKILSMLFMSCCVFRVFYVFNGRENHGPC